jgi:hypothetical protein
MVVVDEAFLLQKALLWDQNSIHLKRRLGHQAQTKKHTQDA